MLTTGSGNDSIDNTYIGNNTNDYIDTGAGNDTIKGGAGNDTMIGGTGDDTYVIDSAGDVITELANEGADTVQTALSSYSYSLASLGNLENLVYTGSSAFTGTGNVLNNTMTGGIGNDRLSGGAGNDTLSGGAGTDTLIGGTGDDTYVVDSAGDVITELVNEGADTLQTGLNSYSLASLGNVENLVYTGSSAFTGTGNMLNNTMTGGSGNDTLSGGAGTDTLTGGAGNDTFVFASSGNGTDTITDFTDRDTIQLSQPLNGPITVGDGTSVGLNRLQVTTVNNLTTLSIGTDANPGADITIQLVGTFDPAQLALAGNSISFSHGAEVAILAYSWKAHTLLDGVSISGGGHSGTTANGGSAAFSAVTDTSLTLTASRSIPTAEASATNSAVNLQDAIAILKMIVGLPINGSNPLSPYQTLAADYDGNGTVGLTDAIGVLKHVVGLTAPAPSWHFVNEIDTTIPGKTGNLSPGTPQATINADLSGTGPVHIGLVGYLRGDVDGSYAGAAGALDLDTTQSNYFTTLVTSQAGLNHSQFGIYS